MRGTSREGRIMAWLGGSGRALQRVAVSRVSEARAIAVETPDPGAWLRGTGAPESCG
jgi:hypothetical protein